MPNVKSMNSKPTHTTKRVEERYGHNLSVTDIEKMQMYIRTGLSCIKLNDTLEDNCNHWLVDYMGNIYVVVAKDCEEGIIIKTFLPLESIKSIRVMYYADRTLYSLEVGEALQLIRDGKCVSLGRNTKYHSPKTGIVYNEKVDNPRYYYLVNVGGLPVCVILFKKGFVGTLRKHEVIRKIMERGEK